MAETETADVGQQFAELMSGAAAAVAPPVDPEAPFGWTRDAQTGEMRPKKAPGRPRKSPSLDELKAQRDAEAQDTAGPGASAPPEGDRPPSKDGPKPQPTPDDTKIPYYPGRIARGMAKWYRRIGRIWRIYRPATGQAFIDSADDIGEAWEDVARGNPKVRKVLNWLVTGGAWGALFLAHLPIFLAMIMEHEERAAAKFEEREIRRAKEAAAHGQSYTRREYREFPLLKWFSAFAESAMEELPETSEDGEGISKADMGDLMGVAASMMSQLGFTAPGDLHPSQVPDAVKEAVSAAAGNGQRVAPQDHKAARRPQPHRTTRAQRKK